MAKYIQVDSSDNINGLVEGVGLLGGNIATYKEISAGAYTDPSQVTASYSAETLTAKKTITIADNDVAAAGTISFDITSSDTVDTHWVSFWITGRKVGALKDSSQITGGTGILSLDWSGAGGGADEIGEITVAEESTGYGTGSPVYGPYANGRHKFLTT